MDRQPIDLARLGNPERCATERPALRAVRDGHEAACHFAEELLPGQRRDALIGAAAHESSAFATVPEEAIGPTTVPSPDEGGLFDRGGPSGEDTHGRV